MFYVKKPEKTIGNGTEQQLVETINDTKHLQYSFIFHDEKEGGGGGKNKLGRVEEKSAEEAGCCFKEVLKRT